MTTKKTDHKKIFIIIGAIVFILLVISIIAIAVSNANKIKGNIFGIIAPEGKTTAKNGEWFTYKIDFIVYNKDTNAQVGTATLRIYYNDNEKEYVDKEVPFAYNQRAFYRNQNKVTYSENETIPNRYPMTVKLIYNGKELDNARIGIPFSK